MQVSDNDLMILEQLTYLSSSVAEAANVEKFKSYEKSKKKTIGEILSVFTEEKLKELETHTEALGMGDATGVEWASMIRYLKNSNMSNLILIDTMQNEEGTTLALCFVENIEDKNAIVAFKGTSGPEEWKDNVEGFNLEDTKCQKAALDYIECLEYDDITVVGHSKGGNKAMYVAITSDKISHCVSMDGQGFSQEFIDKYWAEINERGNIITNYSISTDYVHVLLFPVPNSQQVYCQGYDRGVGINDPAQHHSPSSFFVTDKNGNLLYDKNGNVQIVQISEDKSATMIHEFTTFVLNNATADDKTVIVKYLSGLLPLVFTDEPDSDEIIEYVLKNPDALATVLAYLVKYMDEYDLDSDDIAGLLEMLGLDELNSMINIDLMEINLPFVDPIDIDFNIINYIKDNLTDNDGDWITTNVLIPILSKMFLEKYDIDIKKLWKKTDSKIKTINGTKGIENYQTKAGQIHDFSKNVYNTLMDVIDKIDNLNFDSASTWNQYAEYDWFFTLSISVMIKGITSYSDNLKKMNSESRRRIEKVFDEVCKIDTSNANIIDQQNSNIKSISNGLLNIMSGSSSPRQKEPVRFFV